MTLKTVYASVGFLSGLFLSFYAGDLISWSAAFCIFTCLISLLLSRDARNRILLVAVSFFVALVLYNGYTHARLLPLEALDGKKAEFNGHVEDVRLGDRSTVIVSGEIDGVECKAVMYVNNFSGDLCDDVSFTAEVSALDSNGLFDERTHYLPDGIFVRLSPESDITVTTPKRYTLNDRLKLYSRYCSEKIREYVGGDEGSFITAMATGDTAHLSSSLRRSLNRTGIGHVTSVSGLHVSVAAAFILLIFRKLGLGHSVCSLLAYIPVVVYVIFAGCEISAIRSAVMFLIYLLSTVFLRRPHSCNTLALCAIVITLFDPYAAADTSFILSLSGVFAVGVAAPKLIRLCRVKSKILSGLIISLCAWLITAPALLIFFDEISILSPIMNFTLPLCSVALVLTLIFVLCGCLPILSFLPKLAGLAVKPVIRLSALLSEQNFAAIPTLENGIPALAVFLSIAALLFCLFMTKPKFKIMSALSALVLFLMIYSTAFTVQQSKLMIDVIYSGKDALCVLHKADECIIIDINNGQELSEDADRLMSHCGVDTLYLATVNSNGEAAYSSYAQMAIKPEELYLPEDAYIFDSPIPIKTLGEQNVITFAGSEIFVTDNGIHIRNDGESIAISYGLAKTGDCNISIFDGAAVVDGRPISGEGILTVTRN